MRWLMRNRPAIIVPKFGELMSSVEPQLNPVAAVPPTPFVDRRQPASSEMPDTERRQFANSYSDLSEGARELAQAIDQYKLRHRRRFITYEEMYDVILSLGYEKNA